MCEERIIPGYDKKYSINSKGEVFRLWLIHNVTKKRITTHRKLKPHRNNKGVKNLRICVSINHRSIRLLKLMANVFNLHPNVDYKLFPYNANGDVWDCSIENIRFRTLREDVDSFNNDYSLKKCKSCHSFLPLDKFEKYDNKVDNMCLLLNCSLCYSRNYWKTLRENPKRWKNYLKTNAIRRNTPEGKALVKKRYMNERDKLTDTYIKGCVRLPKEMVTFEIIQLFRERIKIKRELKNYLENERSETKSE